MRHALILPAALFASILGTLAPATADPARAYTLRQWTTEDGLPSHSVTGIAQTADGYLWLATTGGLVRFDGHRFVVRDDVTARQAIRIRTVFVDHGGALWFSTTDDRLFKSQDRDLQLMAEGLPVISMAEDRENRLWVADNTTLARRDDPGRRYAASSEGIAKADLVRLQRLGSFVGIAFRQRDVVASPEGPRRVRHLGDVIEVLDATGAARWRVPAGPDLEPWLVDRDSALWVWTGSSLDAYRPGSMVPTARVRLPAGCAPVVLFEGGEGNLWIGTREDGLFRVGRTAFRVYGADIGQARAVNEGSNGRIVLRGEDGSQYAVRGDTVVATPDSATFVFTDRRGTEWNARGANLTGVIDGVPHQFASPIGAVLPRLVTEDPRRDGVMWLGTRNAVVRFAPYEDATRPFGTIRRGLPSAMALMVERSGALLVANDGGVLLRFTGEKVETYTPADGLPPVQLRTLHEDARGAVWIGSYGGGIIRLLEGRFGVITSSDGLAESIVSTLLEDDDGNLWLGGNRTIQRLSRSEADAFLDRKSPRVYPVSYGRGAGLVNPEGSGQPGLRGRDGRLWFPTFAGAVAVEPAQAVALETSAPVVHVEHTLGGSTAGGANGPVRVAPGERRLSFEYTGISLPAPDQVRYQYRLDGLDPEWIDAGIERVAVYTHVPPGSYTFRVRATRGGGVWSRDEATVAVQVVPAFHETRTFAFAAAGLLLGLAFSGYRYRTIWLRKRAAELEALVGRRTRELGNEKATVAKQADELQALNRAKSRFFANISHEFRTPLTLIQGPLDDLLAGDHGEIAPGLRQQVEMSARNSRRLLRLVDQLLDVAKSESGTLRLRAQRADFGTFALGIAQAFTAPAERKAIAFAVDVPPFALAAWFDPDLMEKVLVNLLGNAVKFTPPGGRISLTVREEPGAGELVAVVRDSGPGIAATDLPHIFERFYRGASSKQAGTGIGLALVRESVDLHRGTVDASSSGDGSTFRVRLPLGRAHLADAELAADDATMERLPPADELEIADSPAGEPAPATTPGEAPTVLVVDDNADVRAYLTRQLARLYRVVAAEDGESGLRAVRAHLPDIVVSDVMMPGLDGFGLCRAIRQDPETAFVPVILLTARVSQESRVEGLETGADDYLAKPFDVRELKVRIANLLASRRRLEQRTVRLIPAEAPTRSLHPSAVDVTSDDEAFLDRLRQTIEHHMGEDTFGVEPLAAAMGQSRATLYRRVQALLDQSPMDLVWGMRLDRAAHLLTAQAGTVAEVAYAVGFSSVSHFSRRFKERHGRSPSDLRAGGPREA